MQESASVIDDDGRFRTGQRGRYRWVCRGGTGVTYPGGKNGAGVYQRIINNMPPHAVYIEPFLGSGAVLRHKRPADRNIGIDRSANAISLCLELVGDAGHLTLIEGDALKLLPSLGTQMGDSSEILLNSSQTLIYVDPPYMAETRKGGDLYEFEMRDQDHERLLEIVTGARCMVMISGYRSALYDDQLKGFHRVDYMAQTRRGAVEESLWMNFPPPTALHDYTHLGEDFRERERINRKKKRWAKKFAKLDRLERLAIMDALTDTLPKREVNGCVTTHQHGAKILKPDPADQHSLMAAPNPDQGADTLRRFYPS